MSPQHSMHMSTDKSPDSPTPLNTRQASRSSSGVCTSPPPLSRRPLGWSQRLSASPPAPRLSSHGFRLPDSPLPALRLSPPELPEFAEAITREKGASPVLSLGSSITSPSRYTHVRSYSSPDKLSHRDAIPRVAQPSQVVDVPMVYRLSPPHLPRLNTSPTPHPAMISAGHWTPSGSPPSKRVLLRDYYPTPITISPATQPRWGAPPPPAPQEVHTAMQPPQGLKSLREARYRSPPPLQHLQVEIKAEPEDSLTLRELGRPASTFRPPTRPRLLIHPYASPAIAEPDARRYYSAGAIAPRPAPHTTSGSQLASAHGAPQAPNVSQRLASPSSTISSAGGLHRPGPRKRADDVQLAVLNEVFERTAYPSTEEREDLARRLGMTSRSVQIWFQNRRRSVKVEAQSAVQRAENEVLAAQASEQHEYRGRAYEGASVETRRF